MGFDLIGQIDLQKLLSETAHDSVWFIRFIQGSQQPQWHYKSSNQTYEAITELLGEKNVFVFYWNLTCKLASHPQRLWKIKELELKHFISSSMSPIEV